MYELWIGLAIKSDLWQHLFLQLFRYFRVFYYLFVKSQLIVKRRLEMGCWGLNLNSSFCFKKSLQTWLQFQNLATIISLSPGMNLNSSAASAKLFPNIANLSFSSIFRTIFLFRKFHEQWFPIHLCLLSTYHRYSHKNSKPSAKYCLYERFEINLFLFQNLKHIWFYTITVCSIINLKKKKRVANRRKNNN